MKFMETLRKLFIPGYVDRKIKPIEDDNIRVYRSAADSSKSHADLLKKNGVMMQIYIASGGDRHGH